MSPEADRSRAAADPPDEDLVREWRRGPDSPAGRAAADRLLRRYTGRTYAWCLRVVEDRELARDLAQDALLSAWRGLHRFREDAKFSSWLFAIVRNRCRSHLRRPALFEADEDPDARAGDGKGPAQDYEEQEGEARLMAVMQGALEPAEQEALWLRCFEGLPVDEITRVLGVTGASGARGLLQAARRKLRAALDRAAEREATGD